jgi:hypothetical protein
MKVASELQPGERVLLSSGRELEITRILRPFLGTDDLLCLVEDTADGWFAQGMAATQKLEILES